jgi:hypothetical protein
MRASSPTPETIIAAGEQIVETVIEDGVRHSYTEWPVYDSTPLYDRSRLLDWN